MTTRTMRLPPLNTRAARTFITLAAWATVALLALSASVVTYNSRGLTARNKLMGQVDAIQLASQQLMSDLLNAETGQRGYLLTNDPSYLEPYRLARNRLDADFLHLYAAPLSTPARTAEIEKLESLARAKFAELARTIQLHDAGQSGAAILLVRTNYGKQLMDAMRAQVAALQAGAYAKLAPTSRSPRSGGNAVMLLALAALLFAGVLWAKRKIELDIRGRFYRLERFTRAFGAAKGTLRSLDGQILFWGGGAQRLYGFTADEALEKPFDELVRARCSQSFEEIRALLLENDEWQGEVVCIHKDGRELHLMSDWTLSRGEAGQPDVVIEVSTDITAIRAAERERERIHALLSTVMETAQGLIYAKDREGRMIMANASVLELIGKPWSEVQGRTDLEFLDNQEQAAQIVANDKRIMDQGNAEEVEEEVGSAGQPPRIWSSTKAPFRDSAANVIGLVGVSIDITDRKRSEDRLHLMVNELNHRVKNTLTTVQAIASQTLREAQPIFQDNLEARLMALAAAHDVLTRDNWEGASLHEVTSKALAPFVGREGERCRVLGPQLYLSPRAALAIAMGLHELGANALTYGALATPSGQIEVEWDVTATKERIFRLTWTERGGPPVSAPSKYGLGIRLIQRVLAQDLGGTAVVRFDDPQGVRCVVEAPLAEVAAPGGVMPMLRVGA